MGRSKSSDYLKSYLSVDFHQIFKYNELALEYEKAKYLKKGGLVVPFKIGPTEIILILALLLIIFGPSKLPELAKSIGKSVTELKDGLKVKPEKENTSENSNESQSQ